MMRPFLFLAGEFRVSMPTVFEREHWSHTMSPSRLVVECDKIRREYVPAERLDGVIHYANVEDDSLERANLELLIERETACWPDPRALVKMLDRHEVLKRCIDLGAGKGDRRVFVRYGEWCPWGPPLVVKTGNAHRGQGKFLVRSPDEMPTWDGIATIEPFFDGVSTRILVIGERHWVARYDNPGSWIKNSAGAEVSPCDLVPPDDVVEEARWLTAEFGLEVAGLDYVVTAGNRWRFVEINQYPGLDVFDDEVEWARAFLRRKMDAVEKMAR